MAALMEEMGDAGRAKAIYVEVRDAHPRTPEGRRAAAALAREKPGDPKPSKPKPDTPKNE